MKENQPRLRQDIATIWEGEPYIPPQAVLTNKRRGRVEKRQLWASPLLVGYSDWPHPSQVCRLKRTVPCKGKTRQEVAYAVTSLPPEAANPDQLLDLWRGHWGIENRLHWVRDMTMDEDRCQVHTGAGPQVMAALRNTAIGRLRMAGAGNIAAAFRRRAMHPDEALSLINIPPQPQ